MARRPSTARPTPRRARRSGVVAFLNPLERRGRPSTLAATFALVLLAAPLLAEGQQPAGKVYRIGVLANALETADGPQFEAFLDGLARLGYVEDQNLVIEWRSSEGDMERLPRLAAELVRSKVDLIVATSLQPARAAAAATRTIPIVFVVTADPIGQGLVADLARPGGNITGLATYVPREISERVFQLLREATIKVSRLAVLMNPSNAVHRDLMFQTLPSAAQRAGVTLLPLAVQSLSELQSAFDVAVRERADALYVLGDVFNFVHRARIVALAARHRLPAIYASRRAVEAGGLMSYGPQVRDLFRRAATYVDKILKGAKPGDLPVEQPTRFELAINVKTARALGLTIPPPLLRSGRGDPVIQSPAQRLRSGPTLPESSPTSTEASASSRRLQLSAPLLPPPRPRPHRPSSKPAIAARPPSRQSKNPTPPIRFHGLMRLASAAVR